MARRPMTGRPPKETVPAWVDCPTRLGATRAILNRRGTRFDAVTRYFHETVRGSVLNDARGLVTLETIAPFEGQQFNQESQAHDLAA